MANPSDLEAAEGSETIDGVNVAGVSAWFEANIAGATLPLSFELIAGGRSNLTFKVTDGAGKHYVLRRPPVSHVLPTAHDMSREHKIIAALGPVGLPVPPALGFCGDESVNGRPFYVMGYVDGIVLRNAQSAERLDATARRTAGYSLVDVLARIHAVDVDEVGLGDLGRKEGYIARQLKRWYGQYEQSKAMGGPDEPLVDTLHGFFSERIPEQGPASIVHGDYRLDNTIVGDDGNVRAVLDWEICTVGDPLADVGLLMVYWVEPGDETPPLLVAPTTLPGFPPRADLRARYAERSGRDVSQLDFYVAFGYWKLACIIAGVFARYAGGAGGGDSSDYRALGSQVSTLARAASEAAAKLR
ncbi:MAG TPA: phosphotransferase family protein [Acidimicrobiales bacterium]|nr:phosphotransferase family protein [Acidimicrobiales bacterium]